MQWHLFFQIEKPHHFLSTFCPLPFFNSEIYVGHFVPVSAQPPSNQLPLTTCCWTKLSDEITWPLHLLYCGLWKHLSLFSLMCSEKSSFSGSPPSLVLKSDPIKAKWDYTTKENEGVGGAQTLRDYGGGWIGCPSSRLKPLSISWLAWQRSNTLGESQG